MPLRRERAAINLRLLRYNGGQGWIIETATKLTTTMGAERACTHTITKTDYAGIPGGVSRRRVVLNHARRESQVPEIVIGIFRPSLPHQVGGKN